MYGYIGGSPIGVSPALERIKAIWANKHDFRRPSHLRVVFQCYADVSDWTSGVDDGADMRTVNTLGLSLLT